jgi:hypothetical protein
MNPKKKPTQVERIAQLEAGLDFQNRESEHILDMLRKHHAELLVQQDNLNDLKSVLRIYSVAILVCISLTIYFACK